MARRLKSVHLDSKEARSRLKPRGKPYWTVVERGQVHLGYRRLAKSDGTSMSGRWIVRHYLGNEQYSEEAIGVADDLSNADGSAVFDFDHAVKHARARMAVRAENAIARIIVAGHLFDMPSTITLSTWSLRKRPRATLAIRQRPSSCPGLASAK